MGPIINSHIVVQGRVQGVGFRAFTERAAMELSLRGKVRNLRDGRVEIIAQGEVHRLKDFEKRLLEGPRLAKVDSLRTKEIAGELHFERFSIEKDGELPWFEI